MYYPDFLPHHHLPVLLTKAEHDDPKQAIVAFFECYHPVEARKSIKQCIKAAFSDRRLRRAALLDIIALKEALLRLLEAATLLKDEGKATIPPDEADPLKPGWYSGTISDSYSAWDYLPRHLSEKQYRNPYRVFKQCTKRSSLPQWRGVLEGLIAAASYCNMHGEDGCINYVDNEPSAYAQCKRLIELVEAAHLIYIRERLIEKQSEEGKYAA